MPLTPFYELLARRTGIRVRDRDRASVETAIRERSRVLGSGSLDEYLGLLLKGTPVADGEWSHLLGLITNNESYFFRDQAQMAILRDQILPELIRRNLARPAGSRALHLWSAGCSTGEEPYSLAMMLRDLLPDPAGWNVRILGTDISEPALKRARRGHYGEWSFRLVDPAIRDRYFQPMRGGFQIDPQIRSMVQFHKLNLASDLFPSDVLDVRQMDLILCRNVFIYLDEDVVRSTIEKFARTLVPGGYLLTGHAELAAQGTFGLRPRRFPGSIVYERAHAPVPIVPHPDPEKFSVVSSEFSVRARTPEHPNTRTPEHLPPKAQSPAPNAPHPTPSTQRPTSKAQVATLVTQFPAPHLPQHPTPNIQRQTPNADSASLSVALTLADQGLYSAAADQCHEVLRLEPLNFEAYLLLASLSEEQGDIAAAADHCQRALYLQPESIDACLALSHLYEQMGDGIRATRLRILAEELSAPA